MKMRKNSARKWLHFTLDLLPVIAIPVFMIYSHRHSLTERTNVEINYQYETNEVNTVDDLLLNNVYHLDNLDFYYNEEGVYYFNIGVVKCERIDYGENTLTFNFDYVDDYSADNNNFINIYFGDDEGVYFDFSNTNGKANVSVADDVTLIDVDFFIVDDADMFKDYCTQYGILPSSSTFNVIESVNADTTNENILNVFYKDFTDTIDNYFNFDNVFTFGDIWEWFNTNMFGGNASPIAHAIYEIIVYEFIIDIMFLSYAVFMFIIDFTTDTLERFTGWSSRG